MLRMFLWALAVALGCLGLYAFIFARPQNIILEDDLSCSITSSGEKYASYLLRKYGQDKDFRKVHFQLYRHGFYLRDFKQNKYIYVSNGDGSVCFLRRFTVDSLLLVATLDSEGKLENLRSN